jgi:hypothetical protein
MSELVEDHREIKAIYLFGGRGLAAPKGGRIYTYNENGEMSHAPWFAICEKDGRIARRVNAAHVELVEYKPAKSTKE